MAFSESGAFSGALAGAGTGALVGGPIGAAVGGGIGLLAGGLLGGEAEEAEEEAKEALERARVGSVMREFAAQVQAQEAVASGVRKTDEGETDKKSGSSSKESIIPDPIAETNQDGFIGGGVPNAPATNTPSTSGTF